VANDDYDIFKDDEDNIQFEDIVDDQKDALP
jgi:hypothetical protein